MLSQVYILKAKNRNDDARRICETMLTQYRTSFWAGEAMQQLRLLKPITSSTPPPTAAPTHPADVGDSCRRQRRKLRPRQISRRACRRQRNRRTSHACCSHRSWPVFGCDAVLRFETAHRAVATALVSRLIRLTFRELETFPCAGLSGFLSLFHARIATQQALGFERAAQDLPST